jgi:glycosyltransferase involved in cell wall biosynthesis
MQAPAPIRILLIAPSSKIIGGQSVQASRLLSEFGKEPSIRVDFQPIDPEVPRPLRFLLRVKYLRTLTKFCVYCSQLLWRVPRYDILHVFSAAYTSYMFWSLPALFTAKLSGRKIILNYRDGQAEDHLKNWRTALPTLRMMDVIVSNTPFLVDVFSRFGLRIRAIWNIIDANRFIYRQRSCLRPVFLHNRILEPLYNIQCSLRAFQIVQQRYPGASLTVGHDGPSRAELEAFARSLDLKNTRFIGAVPHSEVNALYDSADIYFTSPDFDCMPGSLLECFASGLPVVATAVGGIPYIAGEGETALLVPADDHRAMADAAFRLLEDPALVESLTKKARAHVEQFDAYSVRRQWTALYHEALGRQLPAQERE